MKWDRDKEGWFFPIVVGLAVALVAALHIAIPRPAVSVAAQPPARATSEPPIEPSSSMAEAPLTAFQGSAREPIALVFECRADGQTIFSDQRCGTQARLRSIQAPNSMQIQRNYETVDASTNYSPPPNDRDRQAMSGVSDRRAVCDQIEVTKKAIDARMREGYSSGEGELLRERLRKLSSEYYELRCHHFH
jgi:hypothetical protein